MVADVHNATPTESRLSHEEIFTGKKSQNKLKDFHKFRCPVFVLEAAVQQGNKIPKWQLRSRLALYLGHSPNHMQTIPFVLSIQTRLVLLQYHVVYDDHFMTMQCLQMNILPPYWNELFEQRGENHIAIEPTLQAQHQLSP